MLLWMIACATPEFDTPAPVPSTPTQSPALEEAPPDRVFVQASSLNLRETPDAKGALVGSLTVNSPLTVLERRGDWMQVRVDNGREGWVAAAFVYPRALTAEAAIARAKTGPEAEQLSWWQRAAALDGGRTTLEGLATAYEHAGDRSAAEQVRSQLDWPVALFPPSESRDGQVVVEWSTGYQLGDPREIPLEQWRGYGLDPDEVWWALPSSGVAVKAVPRRFRVVLLSECSGESARIVQFDVPELPVDEVVMAVHRGAAPAHWHEALPATGISKPEASKRAEASGLAQSDGKPVTVHLMPTSGKWIGHVTWPSGRFSELGAEIDDGFSVQITAAGIQSSPLEVRSTSILGERDLTGDGKIERVMSIDRCFTEVRDQGGGALAESAMTCCGC